MKYYAPDIKKILKPNWAHKPGIGIVHGQFIKQDVAEQATFPHDKNLLKKIGLNKGERVLAIAGYYGNWASEIAKAGAEVDYSDIAKSLVIYAKKKYKDLFLNYICSDYALIPKSPKEYDWTFTFEACGGRQGLPIAYLRSLLNKRGGKLVIYYELKHTGGKHKRYPSIIKSLSKIYGARFNIKKINVNASRKQKFSGMLPHRVYTLFSNNSARKKAEADLKIVESLNKENNLLPASGELKESLIRLNKFTKLLDKEFIKEVR